MNLRERLFRLLDPMSCRLRSRIRHRRNRVFRPRLEVLEDRQVLTTIDLAALTANQGSSIFGADSGDKSGTSVSNAGDVNGDGYGDIVIGASRADAIANSRPDAGESYVIFGGPASAATISLSSLGSQGITIIGAEREDRSGSDVSSAGDVNGDGYGDLLIGAPNAHASGNSK